MDCFTPDDAPDASQSSSPDLERVYFVPYRWLKEGIESCVLDENENRAILYTASSAYAGPMKIINNFFNSDLVFNLKREDDWGLSDGNEEEVSAREYALISDEMWLHSLKRHHESNAATKNSVNFSFAEDGVVDVYPLQLRLSVLREANQMTAKITKKDNVTDFYKRACKIFSVESEPLRIWDFSGQTNLYFTNERNKIPKDNQRLSDQEVLLELQVYGMPDSAKCKNESKKEVSGYGGSFLSNGSMGNVDSDLAPSNPLNPIMIGNCGREGSVGLTGLQNLGNTCFMNSAIQCLAHTPQLVEYFLGDYSREINRHNPLGMDGELALAFGDLLRKLWAPGRTPIAPRVFKSKLARFAPQFSGFNQHDSQELLSFLLDGLHEDLNRVKCKPYIEAKDAHGRPDEEVADEYWANHLARNDSIIVDVCQGQYRSTLVCPICNKVSVTFDPFMYLSLPLPSTMTRTMTITVFSTDGGAQPSPYTITVPKLGKCKDLIQALSVACSLRSDESLLVAEIYSHRIIRFLEEPSDSISLIRDDDRLAAYRLQKDLDRFPLVVFMHQRMEEHYIAGKLTSSWRDFGTPLITRFSKTVNGFDINNLFQNLLTPFLRPKEDAFEDLANIGNSKLEGQLETYAAVGPLALDDVNPTEKSEDGSRTETSFQFYVTGDKGLTKEVTLEMYKPVPLLGSGKHLNLIVCWSEKTVQNYDVRLLSSLPEIFKSGFFAKRPQDSVSLYSCLEAFLKEEPLGPEDMWYCPSCKMHRQASKKLDLWRLPEILVIHLKRFSYSRFMKNKLETFVDFPIRDMDLSGYIVRKNGKLYNRYVLYAVSNHYGSMGGGHYTAYVHHLEENRWYDFDDSHVSPVTEDRIKSSAAYVLFYSRVGASKPDHMS